MPLGQGIVDVFEAITRRIEMSGHAPTWCITGPSFEAAWSFAQEVVDEPAVIDRHDHGRWWPRVTLTVTNDPALKAQAPSLDQLRTPPVLPDQRQPPKVTPWDEAQDAPSLSPLEEIFAHQEAVRAARREVPEQRRGGRSWRVDR